LYKLCKFIKNNF